MSSLRTLAAEISAIADDLESHQTAYPIDSPDLKAWLRHLPPNLQRRRLDLIDTLQLLKTELQTPESLLEDLLWSHADLSVLQTILTLRIPNSIPLETSIALSTLSTHLSLPLNTLVRLLRSSTALSIFAFPSSSPTSIAHTPLSRLLATSPAAVSAAFLTTTEFRPALANLGAALQEFPDGSDPSHTSWNLVNGTTEPIYSFLKTAPERAAHFSQGMRFFTAGDHTSVEFLTAMFPWAEWDVPGRVLVDVGGGTGAVSLFLARKTRHLQFVVHDLDEVVEQARALVPQDLEDRVRFEPCDFFAGYRGGKAPDIWFMRWILHNWSDAYALRILRAMVPAMRTGAKVLVYEYVLPEVDGGKWSDKRGRYLDLVMLSCWNGRERTQSAWEGLFADADPRFKFEGVRRAHGSSLSLVEFTWAGE